LQEKPGPLCLRKLTGGTKNRVFEVHADASPSLILKAYFFDPRDRLGAEWRFLEYASARAIRSLREPLARDIEECRGLFGFVPGRKVTREGRRRAYQCSCSMQLLNSSSVSTLCLAS
jgi:hypothetical protein